MPDTLGLPLDELDYGWGDFEATVLPYTHTHILGQDRLTNVAGPARVEARRQQGRDRRAVPRTQSLSAAFSAAMREVFIRPLREQLNRTSYFWGMGEAPPPDTRTAWERALDENFYDPEERERRLREYEEDRCTCGCWSCED